MERSACHKMFFKRKKMLIFWTFSTCIGDGYGQFWWTLTYQRQFLDVTQSGFAIKNVTRLDVIWMKRSSSGVFFCMPNLGGFQRTLFARNDWLFGKQLFYEYQNEKQHNSCWNQLPPCQSFVSGRLLRFHIPQFHQILVTYWIPSDRVRTS